MSLYEITRDTKRKLYCGPTAICACTGLSASEVLAAFDAYRGDEGFKSDGTRKGVRGVSNGELVNVLRSLGFAATVREFHDHPTIAAYLNTLTEDNWRNRIVNVRGHYVAIGGMGIDFCDTKTKQPVPASQAPLRRARVLREFIIAEVA